MRTKIPYNNLQIGHVLVDEDEIPFFVIEGIENGRFRRDSTNGGIARLDKLTGLSFIQPFENEHPDDTATRFLKTFCKGHHTTHIPVCECTTVEINGTKYARMRIWFAFLTQSYIDDFHFWI